MSRARDLFDELQRGGPAAVEQLIARRASEELFLDFKRSADNGAGRTLHSSDRGNYAKALSGFANSEGGIVVWGIDCRIGPDGADIAKEDHPLSDPTAFKSRLEGATSGCTVPACPMVEHAAIHQVNSPNGYVVTLVPRSYLAPHQSVVHTNYYMRAGSNFVLVPHGVLQGMFGRRRVAPVFHQWAIAPPAAENKGGYSIRCEVGILLSTFGPGVVRDIFLNAYAAAPGGQSAVNMEFPDPKRWACHTFVGRAYSVSVDEFKLAPEVMAMPMKLHVTLTPPFASGWHLVLLYGHAESGTTRVEFRASADDLQDSVSSFRDGTLTGGAFVTKALGLSAPARVDPALDA